MNTKRKVKDYIGQNVAIYCSSKEEWDKIVDLFDSPTVKKHYWKDVVNYLGKSDTINITGRGWSFKEHFIKKQYTIYPASDFLEEEPKFDEGKWYKNIGKDDKVYAKCKKFEKNCFYLSDHISKDKQYRLYTDGSYFSEKNYQNAELLTDLSEIQEFLPDGHVDKFPKEMNYKELQDKAWEIYKNVKIGDKYINTKGNECIAFKNPYKSNSIDKNSFIECGYGYLWEIQEGKELFATLLPHDTVKTKEAYDNQPVLNIKESLFEKAKRLYPIGTRYKCAKDGQEGISNSELRTDDDGFIYSHFDNYGTLNQYVYAEDKWAEIVSDGQGINTYGLKVGDILKQEIINAWAYIEGNFCAYVQKGWVDVFCSYGEDRKIEDFRDIDGQIGFHVSGCTEKTHYLKVEGFKEFVDNFYKKEVKSWIQEQDEILDDVIKQHPLTPKECYPSNEIIIPQVIKAQKTIQKITIESPTELDLKLKTIKPKQIQTIKI